MATIVRARLPASQFALGETLAEIPSAEFEMVRVVADGADRVRPYLWATVGEERDLDELIAALEADPSAQSVDVQVRLEDELLVELDWVPRVRVLFFVLVEESATILDARAEEGRWQFRIFFPEHESVSATYDFCEEYGLDLEFDQISRLTDSFRRDQNGLTRVQYETISRAYREGYYDVPRRVNLEELADRFGVSHQALSERLRRGHEQLIANAMRLEAERATG